MKMVKFYKFFKKKYFEGKLQLINGIRMLLFKENEQIFNLLDFDNNEIFMEPLLYSYFNSTIKEMSLMQILYGYIQEDMRPLKINVQSDHTGCIYLPKIGYFLTTEPNSLLEISWDAAKQKYLILKSKKLVNFLFERICYVEHSSIEICVHGNQLLDQYFDDPTELNIEETLELHFNNLNPAIAMLKNFSNEFYELFEDAVKKILIYNSKNQRSFATIRANGTAFLRIKKGDSLVYIIEDLLHQCAHVIFYAISWDKHMLFNYPIDTPLKVITGDGMENRELLGAFYSFYTYCWIGLFLDLMFDSPLALTFDRQEMFGRFTYCMDKFKRDLINFSYPGIFKEVGQEYFEVFKVVYNSLYLKHDKLIESVNLTNQDYEFNMEKFKQLNQDVLKNNI